MLISFPSPSPNLLPTHFALARAREILVIVLEPPYKYYFPSPKLLQSTFFKSTSAAISFTDSLLFIWLILLTFCSWYCGPHLRKMSGQGVQAYFRQKKYNEVICGRSVGRWYLRHHERAELHEAHTSIVVHVHDLEQCFKVILAHVTGLSTGHKVPELLLFPTVDIFE